MFIKIFNYIIIVNLIEISNKELFFKYFGMIILVRVLFKFIRKFFGFFLGGFDNVLIKLLFFICDKNEFFYFEIIK